MIKLITSVFEKTKLVTTYYLKSVLVTTPYKKVKIQSVIINRSILAFTTGLFFIYKPFVENLTVQELRSFDYFKNLTDTSNISQQLEKLFEKKNVDNSSLSDEFDRVVEYKRIFDDIGTAVDTKIFTVYKNFTDSVGIAESIEVVNIFSTNLFYDNITATDDFNGAAIAGDDQTIQFIKSTINIVNWSDNLTRQVAYVRVLDDSIDLTDLKTFEYSKPLINEFVASESILKSVDYNRSFDNSTSYSDLLNIAVAYSRIFVDTGNFEDFTNLSSSKYLSNYAELTESISLVNIYSRSFTDVFSATDDFNGSTVAGDDQTVSFFKHTSNQFNVGETILKTISFTRNLENQAGIADIKFVNLVKVLDNLFNVSEVLNRAVDYNRVFNNTSNISDSILLSNQYSRFFNNELNTTEYYSISTIKSLVSDFNLSDISTITVQFVRNITSTLGVTDNLDGEAVVGDDQNLVIFKNLFSSVQLTDSLIPLIFYSNELQDIESITDYLNYSINKRLINTTNTSDNLLRVVQYKRNYSDAFKSLDSPSKAIGKSSVETVTFVTQIPKFNFVKRIFDVAVAQDVLQLSKNYIRRFTNNLSATDDINGALQLGDENVVAIFKNITDVITISDLDPLIVERKGVSEVAQILDIKRLLTSKRLVNTLKALDVFNKTITFNRPRFEAVNISDPLSIVKIYNRALQESLNISEQKLTVINKNIFETVQTIDTISIGNSFNKPLTSVLGVTDDLNGAFLSGDENQILFVKSLSNSYSIQEIISVQAGLVKSNILNISEGQKIVDFYSNKTEVLQISDILQKQVQRLRTFDHGTNVYDLPVISLNPIKSETLSISESYTRSINKNIIDLINLQDPMNLGGTYYLALENFTNITDDLNGAAVLGDDQVIQFFKAFSNQTSLQDNLFVKTIQKNLTNTTNIQEIFNFNYSKPKIENLQISELFNKSSQFVRLFTNNTNYSDSAFLKNIYKNINNYANISESGILNIQNYAGYYFEEDYVGQSVDIST